MSEEPHIDGHTISHGPQILPKLSGEEMSDQELQDELEALVDNWEQGQTDFEVIQDAPYHAVRQCAKELQAVLGDYE